MTIDRSRVKVILERWPEKVWWRFVIFHFARENSLLFFFKHTRIVSERIIVDLFMEIKFFRTERVREIRFSSNLI